MSQNTCGSLLLQGEVHAASGLNASELGTAKRFSTALLTSAVNVKDEDACKASVFSLEATTAQGLPS